MSESQTPEQQARTLHKELQALQTDETELSRLLGEKTAELDKLKAGKSRDFASMAALEGQRAALNIMLSEQRAEIAQVRERIDGLSAQRARAAALASIGRKAAQIMTTRGELHAGLLGLVDTLTPELDRLIRLRSEWGEVRAAMIEEARDLGGVTPGQWAGVYYLSTDFQQELCAHGVDLDGVRLTVQGFLPDLGGSIEDTLPTPPGLVDGYSRVPFPEQVRALVGNLYRAAFQAHARAEQGGKA